jgi:hypothetical protein
VLSDYFLFTEEEFKKAKSRQLLPCKCEYCGERFYKAKHELQYCIKNSNQTICCSNKCSHKIIKTRSNITVKCEECGKEFERSRTWFNKSKHNFCSKSCAAKYRNVHKTTGCRRSKLEIYLETKLTEIFPDLEILYNDRKTLPSGLELDIYVPSLKLAFELNGPFHYIPVFGQEKLNKTQNNDYIKLKECQDLGINICVIDVSKDVKFTEKSSEKYLEIIKSFIR